MNEIERRVAAVSATWDHWRGRPHAYGTVDCAKVAAWHLRQMGRRVTGLGKAGAYKSALAAHRALKRAGFDSLAAAMTANGLIEVPPAAALVGDIILVPGDSGHDALCIVAGNGMALAFHEDALPDGLQRVRLSDLERARAFRA